MSERTSHHAGRLGRRIRPELRSSRAHATRPGGSSYCSNFLGVERARESSDDFVAVVWFYLNLNPSDVEACAAILDPNERQRARQCITLAEQHRMTIRLARRRIILSDFCSIAPRNLEFREWPNGKPYVMSRTGDVEFSTSHHRDIGVVAITRRRRVGVDVEGRSGFADSPRLAHLLTTSERAARINAQPHVKRVDTLARLWTNTEAIVKATGEGIASGVDHVRVPLERAQSRQCFSLIEYGSPWHLYALACPQPDVFAALAVEADPSDDCIAVESTTYAN